MGTREEARARERAMGDGAGTERTRNRAMVASGTDARDRGIDENDATGRRAATRAGENEATGGGARRGTTVVREGSGAGVRAAISREVDARTRAREFPRDRRDEGSPWDEGRMADRRWS